MDVVEGEEAKHVADGEGPLRRRAPSCGITGICGATIAPGSVPGSSSSVPGSSSRVH